MAKTGKLMKLKSALKKLNSFGKQKRITSDCGSSSTNSNSNSICTSADREHDNGLQQSLSHVSQSGGHHAVYVGKSRRQYMISSEVLDHPVFQELTTTHSKSSNGAGEINVACEVVLFDHLLWMLEDSDSQMDSLDELVPFYTC